MEILIGNFLGWMVLIGQVGAEDNFWEPDDSNFDVDYGIDPSIGVSSWDEDAMSLNFSSQNGQVTSGYILCLYILVAKMVLNILRVKVKIALITYLIPAL